MNILKLNGYIHEKKKGLLLIFFNRLLQKNESQYLLISAIMEPTWVKQSMIGQPKSGKEKK